MENETELKLFFWIGTSAMLLMALSFLLITIVYFKKVYRIRQEESENLLRASLESEKRERKRIASDFHDGIIGDLNAIRNYVSFLYHKEQDPDKKNVMEDIKLGLDTTLVNIQNISYNLAPPLLETFGLIYTLNDYFERIKKWSTIIITTQYSAKEISVSEAPAYELYRIIQELVSNILKHSNATQINFYVEKKDRKIEIQITDDGIAFDFYKSLKNTSGMGLKNVISRSRQIGARLEQVSVSKGNKILIYLETTIC